MAKKKDHTSIVWDVVKKFKKNCSLYMQVAELLEKYILPELFPDAQKVSARSKAPDSIAGKVLKKYIQLDNSDEIYNKFTDLVGARVIFLRRDQVDAADARIRAFFTVDDHNSQNTVERLNEREFGYQSRHYIVRIDREWINDKFGEKEKTTESNVSPENINSHYTAHNTFLQLAKENSKVQKLIKKIIEKLSSPIFIELQIRTWLQHVWADLSHDSIYKGDRVIPRELMRSWNAIAAILENVDEDIVRCLDQLEQYRKNSAYNIAEEVDQKIETMKIITGVQLKQCSSKSLMKKEHHHLILSYDELLRLQKIKQGSDEDLQNLIVKIEEKIKVSSSPKQDLTNPKDLLDFLSENNERYDDPMLVPLLNMALDRCENMIRSCSELPWAFAGKAFFNMLLFQSEMNKEEKEEIVGKIYDSILRLIDLCNERSVANLDQKRRIATPDSQKVLTKLKYIFCNNPLFEVIPFEDEQAPVWKCVQKMLELGSYAHVVETANLPASNNDPAVIVAGGCDSLAKTQELSDFKNFFFAALAGNTKIHFYTGGGNTGICSLDFGTINEVMRFGCKTDTNVKVKSAYNKHSIWEALLTWNTLKDKKYRFDDVALVGFGLGEISSWECRIALAFGARVTVIGHKDFLSYDRTFEGIPYWSDHPSLVRLPMIRGKEPANRSFKVKNNAEFYKGWRDCGFPEPVMLRVFMLFKPYHENAYRDNSPEFNLAVLINRIKQLRTFIDYTDLKDLNDVKKLSSQHRLLSFCQLYCDAKNEIPNMQCEEFPTYRKGDLTKWIDQCHEIVKNLVEPRHPDYDFGEREHARWYIERWLQGTRYGINKIDKGVPNERMKNPCMVAWFDLDDDTIIKDTDFISRYLVANYIDQSQADAKNDIAQLFNRS